MRDNQTDNILYGRDNAPIRSAAARQEEARQQAIEEQHQRKIDAFQQSKIDPLEKDFTADAPFRSGNYDYIYVIIVSYFDEGNGETVEHDVESRHFTSQSNAEQWLENNLKDAESGLLKTDIANEESVYYERISRKAVFKTEAEADKITVYTHLQSPRYGTAVYEHEFSEDQVCDQILAGYKIDYSSIEAQYVRVSSSDRQLAATIFAEEIAKIGSIE